MNLKKLSPLYLDDPIETAAIQETFKREVAIYRKTIYFRVGMLLSALGFFSLIYITEGALPRLALFAVVLGCGLIYDSVVAHFSKRINELCKSSKPTD